MNQIGTWICATLFLGTCLSGPARGATAAAQTPAAVQAARPAPQERPAVILLARAARSDLQLGTAAATDGHDAPSHDQSVLHPQPAGPAQPDPARWAFVGALALVVAIARRRLKWAAQRASAFGGPTLARPAISHEPIGLDVRHGHLPLGG